jgi:hypothetical protein
LGTTYSKPLGIVDRAGGEEGVQRIVCRNGEANGIDEEFGGNVEEDEEEVQGAESENNIDLGNGGLLLKVIEDLVLAELRKETHVSLRREPEITKIQRPSDGSPAEGNGMGNIINPSRKWG